MRHLQRFTPKPGSFFRLTALASALALSPLAFSQSIRETTVEAIVGRAVSPVAGEVAVTPTLLMKVPEADSRSLEQMDADSARALSAPQRVLAPFLPTMGDAAYLSAKAAGLLLAPSEVRPVSEAQGPLAPPGFVGPSFDGVNQTTAGGLFPPDTHGAVGKIHFVEVTNSHVDIFTKAGALVKSISLASFLGYTTQTLFDPRVVYDRTYDRFVITAEAFPETASVQRHFIAISKSGDPLGPYFIYNINATAAVGTNNFFDFPQLGMDQDSVIITANAFSPNAYIGWRMFAIAKARLYNGLGFSVPVFSGSPADGTLAPPLVLDQNAKTFLVAAPSIGSSLRLYTLRDSSRNPGVILTGPSMISVTSYNVPANAPQCGSVGTAQLLDTSDARFANASTQVGNFLWNAHSINFGPAAVRWYKVDTSLLAINKTATNFAGVSSSDFNPSIAANDAGDIFLTWSSSSSTVCPQVRFSGQRAADAAGTGVNGIALFTSPTRLTGNFDSRFGHQRWGDYSAVTVDPTNSLRAWLVNEKVNSTNVWGTRIGQIGF